MKLKLQSRKRELEMSDKEINMESDINDKIEKKGTFDNMLAQTEDERQKQNRGLSLKKEQSGIEK